MSEHEFPPVPSGYPFPRLELEVLERWRRDDTFRRTVAQSAGRPELVFYEGPPTANNVPHVGHVVTRVVKDLFPRFRTMQGYHVARKAGWDTHGLAVEIEVEKRLGFSGKQQIEEYGIAAFNRACLDSVHTYERQWRAMTERVGYWTDLDHAYWTFTNEYVESVWWALARLHEQGLLYEGFKVQWYCARCGTGLSSHEVAQNYQEADDPSIWTLFVARPGQRVRDARRRRALPTDRRLELVAWTTTPWTTLANVALAVHPELTYKAVADPRRSGRAAGHRRGAGHAGAARPSKRTASAELLDLRELPAVARFSGRDLDGLLYDRLYTFAEPDLPGRVVLADYVTASEGTGLVHTAPPFGEDDYATSQREDLALIFSVDDEGKIKPGFGPWAGRWFKDADAEIIRDLRGARPAPPRRPLPPQLPLLLAVRPAAALLRPRQLVRQDDRPQGEARRAEPDHRLAPGARPRRPLRQLAGERRRLGAVAPALLGDAAAGLEVRPLPGRRGGRAATSGCSSWPAASGRPTSTTASGSTPTARSSTSSPGTASPVARTGAAASSGGSRT